jgi:Phosphotransferase enzyme family
MRDGLDDARALLPGVRLEPVETLTAGDRSEVRRVRAEWPGRPPTTLVVKAFENAGEGWVRETAALTVIAGRASVGRLIAAGASPPIVIMSDAGGGPSVADALLGADPDEAGRAVLLWAETIGRLHAATTRARDEFRTALAERSGNPPVSDVAMSSAVDDTVRLLESQCGQLGVPIPHGALAELRELPRRLNSDTAAALTPADACPDNNIRIGTDLVLIDFEGAQWRHVAWDVAYLSVPWPSCWCSWRIPGELAERAVERYRRAADQALPYVRSAEFRPDVASAAAGWALISTTWFLGNALREQAPSLNPDRPTPTRRAMIVHRLDRARRCAELPAVAELAARLHAELTARWGELHLALAPAFAEQD